MWWDEDFCCVSLAQSSCWTKFFWPSVFIDRKQPVDIFLLWEEVGVMWINMEHISINRYHHQHRFLCQVPRLSLLSPHIKKWTLISRTCFYLLTVFSFNQHFCHELCPLQDSTMRSKLVAGRLALQRRRPIPEQTAVGGLKFPSTSWTTK